MEGRVSGVAAQDVDGCHARLAIPTDGKTQRDEAAKDEPNALKIPAGALRKLSLGRYQLSVTAISPSGAAATARRAFAVIPRNR